MSGELERGRQRFRQRSWDEAYRALAQADRAQPLSGADLESLAWAAGLSGRDEAFLTLLERLHHSCSAAGNSPAAARWAFWLGFRLVGMGEMARAGGWLARAGRLLDDCDADCVERGYLRVPLAHRQLASGDNSAASKTCAEAAAIGERFGDRDLCALARNLQGRALLRQGRTHAGLALLDEAMLAATAGELSPLVAGVVYCSVIATCQQAFAIDRAREWTEALSAFCRAQPQLVAFTGSCLVHRAEIMQLQGDWGEALAETRRVCERFADALDSEGVGDAFYQQAEIHRLRGELAAAEEGYRSANRYGRSPQPGLALLRVAQGRARDAVGAIRRALAETPPGLARARLLPACVEIMLASGEREQARSACEELERLASEHELEALGALAAHARGSLHLAEGEARAALEPLRAAFRVWQQVGAPYLAARLRVLLARACAALGDADGAALELDVARQVFERLGAAPDLSALSAASQPVPAAVLEHGLTRRELEVLRLLASGKTNRTIGRELVVSEKTVDRHVSNIFTKLDVSSRAAATAYAYKHGLLH